MKLHLANTDDGYMLWGVFLTGRHNDSDGGIDIYHEWFMVARSEIEVRDALGDTVEGHANRYRWYPDTLRIEYRPMSASELVICSRSPGGRLNQVTLASGSPAGFNVRPALMDTRN